MVIDADFELCDRLDSAIVEHYGNELRANELSEAARAVVLVWLASGIIGNGGFEYLFEADVNGDPGYRLTLAAFRAIECDIAADALADALAQFPNGDPPADLDERIDFYQGIPTEPRLELNRRFWSADSTGSDEIKNKLAQYIRAHKSEFEKLLRR